MALTLISNSPHGTRNIAIALAPLLSPGDVVALIGGLGAGKTEFVKGLAQGLGLEAEQVTSPTFTLINEYPTELHLYHFDFYRLESADQLDRIGAEEYLWGEGVCIVEWADMFLQALPESRIEIRIEVEPNNDRTIAINDCRGAENFHEALEEWLQSVEDVIILRNS